MTLGPTREVNRRDEGALHETALRYPGAIISFYAAGKVARACPHSQSHWPEIIRSK
ncbi:unnamed protein product [Spirodela intermedia]|uniref:Uncharacterized protein n=2 Tax=Spirodela intermedia TaxID=51605 RepID=A0A7I8KVP6_SPIIN|nr:unnamed protein product [Spirodela intermedia]CAA6664804.1 unnamed protein product [Spirodela intermedia]CAA7401406.1 unnamed protein product [Spirodela intermedia]